MQPQIQILPEKRLIGRHMSMSLADNRTPELWKSFMMSRKDIRNAIGTDLFSVQVYDATLDFREFNMQTIFEKWATAEVADFSRIPEGMDALILQGGLYAVFLHKGAASEGAKTFQYIFGTWLPGSEYELDDRPHFEILGDKYKNNQPDSEEEIWIPVRPKK